jgi:hypothetical protein
MEHMSQALKRRFREQILLMLGREPGKPQGADISPRAQEIHELKRMTNKADLQAARAEADQGRRSSLRDTALRSLCAGLPDQGCDFDGDYQRFRWPPVSVPRGA